MASEIELPGSIILTIPSPIVTAITVVRIYIPMVLPPILESLEISLRSEIPFIKEASIRGTAMSFRELMKIVPKGFIKSDTKSGPQLKLTIIKANNTPKNIPISIFQCNSSLRISI